MRCIDLFLCFFRKALLLLAERRAGKRKEKGESFAAHDGFFLLHFIGLDAFFVGLVGGVQVRVLTSAR